MTGLDVILLVVRPHSSHHNAKMDTFISRQYETLQTSDAEKKN